ncbi:hypothetical protein M5F00_00460 [Acinetobacter sp. ANC 4945]|nr:hypothetical protein [Acinetobacter amyesii]MCL6246353.1 hypothetical protein [Acinetobacter amyesii]
MMLKEKLASFPDAVWVQIHYDQMQVLTRDHQIVAEQNCPLAFIERGSFVRNYHVAEQFFNQLIQQIHFKWYEFGQPVIFIQLKERLSEEVSALELQAIQEMALSVNAHFVFVYDKHGIALEAETIKNDESPLLKWFFCGLIFLILLIIFK